MPQNIYLISFRQAQKNNVFLSFDRFNPPKKDSKNSHKAQRKKLPKVYTNIPKWKHICIYHIANGNHQKQNKNAQDFFPNIPISLFVEFRRNKRKNLHMNKFIGRSHQSKTH
jgi:hypothetical protein